ncbi:MAG TPA: hypothetical protein VFG05_04570 [Methylocella sp.]|nr:hypothetical protein [Methylocella sp.]
MLFNIDDDSGSRIIGWLAPDNPAATPKVIVHLDPDRHIVVDATAYRPLLKEQCLHNTGLCGFVITEKNCPGITAAKDLEIKDSENQILIYRRRSAPDLIQGKLLRLETQLVRSHNLDEALNRRFHMTYNALELMPEETTQRIFGLMFTKSLYLSGRVFWQAWEPLARDNGFRAAILLRDPFEELAERLLILKWASLSGSEPAAGFLGRALQSSASIFRTVDLTDLTALQGVLSRPPEELRGALFNPLVYQLAAPNAFDPPPAPETASALDSLAAIDAVGLRSDSRAFLELLAAVLDLPQPLPDVTLGTGPAVSGLADKLRELEAARALIEMDLEVYAEAARVLAPA